jgi:hypothetical protein
VKVKIVCYKIYKLQILIARTFEVWTSLLPNFGRPVEAEKNHLKCTSMGSRKKLYALVEKPKEGEYCGIPVPVMRRKPCIF